jgi:hypothetical protein
MGSFFAAGGKGGRERRGARGEPAFNKLAGRTALTDLQQPAIVLARPLHLVDIPGHPRLRTRSLAQFLPAADGIVFIIDAVSGLTGKNVRDAAE